MCKAQGFEKGGIVDIQKTKDSLPDTNKKTAYASIVGCPQTNKIFAKKCQIMQKPAGKTCEEK